MSKDEILSVLRREGHKEAADLIEKIIAENQNIRQNSICLSVMAELLKEEKAKAIGPYLDGPWSNPACKGYAILAMERAGLDAETIRKVVKALEWCFDDTTTKEAEQHYYKGEY